MQPEHICERHSECQQGTGCVPSVSQPQTKFRPLGWPLNLLFSLNLLITVKHALAARGGHLCKYMHTILRFLSNLSHIGFGTHMISYLLLFESFLFNSNRSWRCASKNFVAKLLITFCTWKTVGMQMIFGMAFHESLVRYSDIQVASHLENPLLFIRPQVHKYTTAKFNF